MKRLTLSALLLLTTAGVAGQVLAQQQPAPPAEPPAASPPAATTPATTPPAATTPTPSTAQPAPAGTQQLPPVEVIQQQPKPPAPATKQEAAPAPKKKAPVPVAKTQPAPAPKKVVAQPKAAPPPPPPPAEPVAPAEPVETVANPVYGSPASAGAAERAAQGPTSPINPSSILPRSLEGFSSAATNVTPEKLAEQQPRNINEVFTQVPGMIVINDDGAGHHGGLASRGSPARRSRKLLVMEDGHPANLALWLDPSVHYYVPADRIESVEVLRGTIITHGPNNNFAVINARGLSPFGPNETVVSSSIGFTKNKTGFFDDGGTIVRGSNDTDISARWHTHTRQMAGNVGVVLSYSGENVQGVWDTERLRAHDFHGAIGWKGVDQDFKVSITHVRQRDTYDELNFTGEDGDPPGLVEQNFFLLKHCKTCYAAASGLDQYFGEVWRGQAVHNAYLDRDTTITTRLYMGEHRRDRYSLISAESNPDGTLGDPPVLDGTDVFLGEDTMFGRLRTFRHVGAEVRAELANRPFIAGMTQTIQTGIRYEYQTMTNRNFLGLDGQILSDGDKTGLTIFDRSLNANAVSAFLQTSIRATRDFTVTPGVRLEWYNIKRRNRVVAGEESEAEEEDPCSNPAFAPDECLVIEDIFTTPARLRESTDSFNALPGISFAYTGFHRTTIFGGYNRGMSTAVMRNEDFPSPDEIGDNFEIGIRSTAIRGLAFEVAGFHQRLSDYQFGSSFSDGGDRSFGRADKVEINGVEILARLNSQPFTGGPLNAYVQGNYTYAQGKFKRGLKDGNDDGIIDPADPEDNFSGNRLPEVPFHVAALTVGLENRTSWGWKWDASMTWTYRGAFFTDEDNTPFGGDPEGEDGLVPEVWLLSARANLHLNNGLSLFVAGDNLQDKLYISDREDGLKPGMGRTIWTGFKYKF